MCEDLEFRRLLATQCTEGIAAMKAEKIIMRKPLIQLEPLSQIQIETEPEVLGDFREVLKENKEGE